MTSGSHWSELLPGQVLLPDGDPAELFLRAISPRQVEESGALGSEAFGPSTTERVTYKQSGARETLQTPQGIKAERGDACRIVCGLSINEIESAGVLRVVDDHKLVKDATGHAFIDIERLLVRPKLERKVTRLRLAELAQRRGDLLTG